MTSGLVVLKVAEPGSDTNL